MATPHAVAATSLFLAAIVADALTAHEDPNVAAPASLRGTGIVLAACFAAPLLYNAKNGVYGHWQRPIIGVCLLLAAMLGRHAGAEGVRVADALYIALVGYACAWLFGAGGVDEQGKAADPGAVDAAVAQSSAQLTMGLLLYASLRALRTGLVHAAEVDGAVVGVVGVGGVGGDGDAVVPLFASRAYAHASETSTLALAYGGAVGVGAALVLAQNAPCFRNGLDAVRVQMAVAAAAAAAAAVVATLASAEQQARLPMLFGVGTCAAAEGECAAAAASRRFALANTPSEGLWLLALGLAVLALPSRGRCEKAAARVPTLAWASEASVPWGAAVIAIAVAFVAALAHCSFTGPQAHVDVVALVVLAAAAWALVVDAWTGAAAGAVGYAGYLWLASAELGAVPVFAQLTNVTLACLTGALALLLLLDATTVVVVFRWYHSARAVLAVAGTSLALLLLLASSCLTLGYSGRLYADETTDVPPERRALKWLLQHHLPLLVWAPVFVDTLVCVPARALSQRVYQLVWLGAAVDVAIVYAIVLAAVGIEAPALVYVDTAPFGVAAATVAILPWALCARL